MKRVLIVDDDARIVERLQALLSPHYETAAASTGFDALRAIDHDHIDAILLDLRMPGLDGPGFVQELRKRGIRTPVVLMSANPNVADQADTLGAADYLVKPFEIERLEEILARL